ncbi:MAG TPA: hypothetical protein VLJ21_04485 [Candidatus Binatia bacterium]|nr:hypothetical protein [Candidatus Binatia bacterium]
MNANTDEAEKRAEELYAHISPQLKGMYGKFIAIELDSGDYALGDTLEEAYEQASRKHPAKEFYFKRVGMRAALFLGQLLELAHNA